MIVILPLHHNSSIRQRSTHFVVIFRLSQCAIGLGIQFKPDLKPRWLCYCKLHSSSHFSDPKQSRGRQSGRSEEHSPALKEKCLRLSCLLVNCRKWQWRRWKGLKCSGRRWSPMGPWNPNVYERKQNQIRVIDGTWSPFSKGIVAQKVQWLC